jgi:hypothetical protein
MGNGVLTRSVRRNAERVNGIRCSELKRLVRNPLGKVCYNGHELSSSASVLRPLNASRRRCGVKAHRLQNGFVFTINDGTVANVMEVAAHIKAPYSASQCQIRIAIVTFSRRIPLFTAAWDRR